MTKELIELCPDGQKCGCVTTGCWGECARFQKPQTTDEHIVAIWGNSSAHEVVQALNGTKVALAKEMKRAENAERTLRKFREALSADRSDGESDFSVGVNAAVRRHIAMFDTICDEYLEERRTDFINACIQGDRNDRRKT